MKLFASLIQIAGFGFVTAAAFTVSTAVGMLVAGVFLVIAGVAVERASA